MKPESAKFSFD